mgnify:CR=1 FL=1
MSQNEFNDFIKIFNDYMGSFTSKRTNKSDGSSSQESYNECNNCRFGNSNANATKGQREACSDIPGGFQDIPPQLLLVIGELLGNVMAGNLPFNIQNVVGNWLQLVGQAIEVFNAQQQYYQGGPGRMYNPIYRNVANPFCSTSSDESQTNVASNRNKKSSSNSSSNSTQSNDDIYQLKQSIELLTKQIDELQKQIDDLKRK